MRDTEGESRTFREHQYFPSDTLRVLSSCASSPAPLGAPGRRNPCQSVCAFTGLYWSRHWFAGQRHHRGFGNSLLRLLVHCAREHEQAGEFLHVRVHRLQPVRQHLPGAQCVGFTVRDVATTILGDARDGVAAELQAGGLESRLRRDGTTPASVRCQCLRLHHSHHVHGSPPHLARDGLPLENGASFGHPTIHACACGSGGHRVHGRHDLRVLRRCAASPVRCSPQRAQHSAGIPAGYLLEHRRRPRAHADRWRHRWSHATGFLFHVCLGNLRLAEAFA